MLSELSVFYFSILILHFDRKDFKPEFNIKIFEYLRRMFYFSSDLLSLCSFQIYDKVKILIRFCRKI